MTEPNTEQHRVTLHEHRRRWEARVAWPCPSNLLINGGFATDYRINGQGYHVARTFRARSQAKALEKAERYLSRLASRQVRDEERRRKEQEEYCDGLVDKRREGP